jgi:urease accessory protein
MLRIEHVLGSRLDPALAERIHQLEHRGAVDLATILRRRSRSIWSIGGFS